MRGIVKGGKNDQQGGSSGYTGWSAPSDWINIDNCATGNINLLVSDTALMTYAFICTTSAGNYHVDWGDGTNGDFASGAACQHTYSKGAGQVCTRGYTTFKVVISPTSGNLTSFCITPSTLASLTQYYGILECVCNAPYLTSLVNAFYQTTVRCVKLEMFKSLCSMPSLLDTSYMFQSCSSLQSVDVSDMVAVQTAFQMFYNCYSLQSVDVSGMTAVQTATNMLSDCSSLQSVDVSGMVAVTNAKNMLNGCSSLRSADVSGMVAVQTATNMFCNCYSLQSIIATNFAKNAVNVDGTGIFYGCEQLTSISMPNAKFTKFEAYGASGKLNKLATLTLNSSSTWSGTAPQINLTYCTLTAAQINTIFTSLPTVTGKTIAVTGCTGASTCTPSIATAKGWTVTR